MKEDIDKGFGLNAIYVPKSAVSSQAADQRKASLYLRKELYDSSIEIAGLACIKIEIRLDAKWRLKNLSTLQILNCTIT